MDHIQCFTNEKLVSLKITKIEAVEPFNAPVGPTIMGIPVSDQNILSSVDALATKAEKLIFSDKCSSPIFAGNYSSPSSPAIAPEGLTELDWDFYCTTKYLANLVKLVESMVRLEHVRTPNRPINLVGESSGGCRALVVAACNPDIDLILILVNPATSFSKSPPQPETLVTLSTMTPEQLRSSLLYMVLLLRQWHQPQGKLISYIQVLCVFYSGVFVYHAADFCFAVDKISYSQLERKLKDECWSNVVRMATKFGAKIIPFGFVGEDVVLLEKTTLVNYSFITTNLLRNIPYFKNAKEELTDDAVKLRYLYATPGKACI
ncbi:Acyltransferase-like protein, chloroplastic [Sesamum alatum]|uniref:Acyltransferase-like protein, chloroplastic n=1 Tax=Sesamum alatum TaxID=300844 RepID=A0AAE2CNI0_9LAMI|nr:Acyltransferase-like protein, chloroplastic [Sesamum alatum]